MDIITSSIAQYVDAIKVREIYSDTKPTRMQNNSKWNSEDN